MGVGFLRGASLATSQSSKGRRCHHMGSGSVKIELKILVGFRLDVTKD